MMISRSNGTFQQLQAVATNRAARRRLGQLFVEGRMPIDAALQSNFMPHSFFYLATMSGDAIIKRLQKYNVPSYELTPELFRQVSGMNEPTGPMVIFKMMEPGLKDVEFPKQGITVVIDRPSNPGNLGTVIRSAVAFGVEHVLLIGHGCDHFEPACITSSRGAIFETKIISGVSIAQLQAIKETSKGQVLSTDSTATQTILDFKPSGHTILVLGNEKLGISRSLAELSDSCVSIPTISSRASLNVACAASIILFQLSSSQFTTEVHK